MSTFTRREWLAAAPSAALIAGTGPLTSISAAVGGSASQEVQAAPIGTGSAGRAVAVHANYPSQDADRVRAVVGASHGNIDRVRELLEGSPSLAKAAWDWGFGDWETALGAASHVGRSDIAELLIAHGARPNVFTFAMLGKLEAVRACIEAVPGVQRIPGPHGITLLAHARAGGAAAASVVEYLESLGDADPVARNLPLSDAQKQTYLGRYRFGEAADEVFEVAIDRRGSLTLKRLEKTARVLNRVDEHDFAPAGAPAVRVRFRVESDRCVALTVHDAGMPLNARRLEG